MATATESITKAPNERLMGDRWRLSSAEIFGAMFVPMDTAADADVWHAASGGFP